MTNSITPTNNILTTNNGNTSTSTTTTNNGNTLISSKEDQKTNYEVGKNESKVISAPGEVKRLTASVVVDGTLDPATQQTIESAVGNAIGMDTDRGDKVSVLGMDLIQRLKIKAKAEVDAMNAQPGNTSSKNTMTIIAGILGTYTFRCNYFLNCKRRRKNKESEKMINY